MTGERNVAIKRVGLFVILFCVTVVCSAEVNGDSSVSSAAAIKTRFEPNATLTDDEIREVVALARDCGVNDVAEIFTYNIHPSSFYGINVKSRERVEGREVSFTTIFMGYAKFPGGASGDPAREIHRRGDFSAYHMFISKLTTFEIAGQTVLIQLGRDFELSLADKIVAALGDGKITFLTNKIRDEVTATKANLKEPMSLELYDEHKAIWVTFSVGEYSSLCLVCLWEDGILKVSDISLVTS